MSDTDAELPTVDEVFANGIEKYAKGSLRYADLGLFTGEEATHLDDLRDLISDYLSFDPGKRPLSVAVFGAPGSGKSRITGRLKDLLDPKVAAKLSNLHQINLTQVSSTEQLAEAIDIAKSSSPKLVPFLFFDEFDCAKSGAEWGWLSWFLAPMQDGAFRSGAVMRELKQAVLIFAGGTASSFESFRKIEADAFRLAKGPDFISRLRGHLDIPGINADERRDLRRAAALQFQMQPREHNRKVDSKLRGSLLNVGRYRFGARSLDAVVQLIPRRTDKESPASFRDLSKQKQLLKMHIDRGPLDRHSIGGSIWLSGDKLGAEAWQSVSRLLFQDGASLVYGGQTSDKAECGPLTDALNKVLSASPERLDGDEPWIEISGTWAGTDSRIASLPLKGTANDRLTQAVQLFQSRVELALRSVAHFAAGGSTSLPAGRFPGVVEELMLSLALRHPVYVSGIDGSARDAGALLGLSDTWGEPPSKIFDFPVPDGVVERKTLFQPPSFEKLPQTPHELVEFLRDHALGTKLWPDNGLSREENRKLFKATDPDEIAKLVRDGLRRLEERGKLGTPR